MPRVAVTGAEIVPGSSQLTSQNSCTLLDGSKAYIFGDGSTWTAHDCTYHADDEDVTGERQTEEQMDEEVEEDGGPEQEQ